MQLAVVMCVFSSTLKEALEKFKNTGNTAAHHRKFMFGKVQLLTLNLLNNQKGSAIRTKSFSAKRNLKVLLQTEGQTAAL